MFPRGIHCWKVHRYRGQGDCKSGYKAGAFEAVELQEFEGALLYRIKIDRLLYRLSLQAILMMRNLITTGLIQAFGNLKIEYRIWRNHCKGVALARKYASHELDKLHLGCGLNRKAGWLNVDLFPPADLTLDLREKFPFPENTFTVIYSEHFFEHIDYPVVAGKFLAECFRVLKSGGLIRLGVPDTEWPLQEYCKVRNDGYYQLAKKTWHPSWCTMEMEHINYHFRQDGEHRFAYDFETLRKVLQIAGFSNVTKTNFDPGVDSESRKIGTLYVTAVRA